MRFILSCLLIISSEQLLHVYGVNWIRRAHGTVGKQRSRKKVILLVKLVYRYYCERSLQMRRAFTITMTDWHNFQQYIGDPQ